MAEMTKQMNVQAGNATASVTTTVRDSMPAVPCPGVAGYKYTGLRYVPKFADPIEWNSTNSYEALTIVINQGNSYTSKQAVPAGVDISNETFWAKTFDFNAQLENTRHELAGLKSDLNELDSSLKATQGDLSALTVRVEAVEGLTVTPEQFGAKADGMTNDLAAFKALGAYLKGKSGVKVDMKSGATYFISFPDDAADFIALNMNNADNIDIAGNGSLVHVASNVNTKYFVNIANCTNVSIHDFTVYSEFDKPSQAFGDHSRENPIGSNINPIVLTNNGVKNVNIHDMRFRYVSVAIDCIKLQSVNTRSQGLTVTDCVSEYHAMFLFANRYDNINVKGCKLTGALKYGDGDHSFYFRGKVDQVSISGIESDDDTYFGADILFYPENPNETYDFVAFIDNYKCTGNALIAAYTGGTIFVNDYVFVQADESAHASTTNYPVFGIRSATTIIASNGSVINKNLVYGTKGKLIVNNVNMVNSTYSAVTLPKNANIEITNSVLEAPMLVLSTEQGAPSASVVVRNSKFTKTTSSQNYAIASRALNTVVEVYGCEVNLGAGWSLFSNNAIESVCFAKLNDVYNDAGTAVIGTLSSSSKAYGNYLNGTLPVAANV